MVVGQLMKRHFLATEKDKEKARCRPRLGRAIDLFSPRGGLVLKFWNDFRMVLINGPSFQTTNLNRGPKSTKLSAK